jgi:hypothetical protein
MNLPESNLFDEWTPEQREALSWVLNGAGAPHNAKKYGTSRCVILRYLEKTLAAHIDYDEAQKAESARLTKLVDEQINKLTQ